MTSEQAEIIITLLKQLVSTTNQPKLGFTNDVGTIKIYCNRQHNCNWYFLDGGDRKPVPITHSALTGYLRELRFEKVERRGKETYKLLVTIAAGQNYILEAGHDTHFAKGLLSAIATLTPQQAMQPITLQPQAGDDDSVLFCRVWLDNESIKAPYDENSDWREISKCAIARVKVANDMPF